MAKAILDTLDGLSADLKTEYRPGTKEEGLEGKFVLKVESVGGWSLEPVEPLKRSLTNAKQERDEARRIIKALGDDFTVEAYQSAMAELDTLKKGTSSEKVKSEIESAKKQLTDKHTKELAARDAVIAQRDAEVNELLIDSQATAYLSELGAKSKLILPVVKQHAAVVRREFKGADGKPVMRPVVIIKQADGNIRMTQKAGSQEDMDLREFIDTLKASDDYAPAFAGSGASGTMSGGNRNGADKKPNNTPPEKREGLSATDRLREARRTEDQNRK